MGPEQVVNRMFVAFAAGDEDVLREVIDDELTFVDPAASGSSYEEWLTYNRPFWEAFPGARMELENQVVAGDTVVSELRYRGVHSGPMATPQGELPPTGREIDVRGASIDRVEGGKIVSHRGYFDQMQFMTQLGLA